MPATFARLAKSRILFGILIACFLWQPILLAAAEVHEGRHALATGHAHDASHPDSGIPPDEPEGSGGALHALLHMGHCCTFPVALVAATVFAAVPTPVSHPATAPGAEPPSDIPATLWRPPISA